MNQQDREEIKAVMREVMAEFMRPATSTPLPLEPRVKGVPYAIRAAAAMEHLQRKTINNAKRVRA